MRGTTTREQEQRYVPGARKSERKRRTVPRAQQPGEQQGKRAKPFLESRLLRFGALCYPYSPFLILRIQLAPGYIEQSSGFI